MQRQCQVFTFLLLFICLSLPDRSAQAQNPIKKTMDPSVYDEWNQLSAVQLVNDGSWVSYEIKKEAQDHTIVLYDTNTKMEVKFPRSKELKFTSNNKFAVFKTSPAKEKLRSLRREKVKEDKLPTDTLTIFNLKNKNTLKIANLKNFQVPADWGEHVVYQLKPSVKEKSDSATVSVDSVTQAIKIEWDNKESDKNGTRLYALNLETQSTDTFLFVENYLLAEKGPHLIFNSKGDSTFQAGVYKYSFKNKKLKPIYRAKGAVKNLTLNESGDKAAFLINLDTTNLKIPPFELGFAADKDSAKIIAHHNSRAIKNNWYVNEHYKPIFSEDDQSLFFGINPKPILGDTSLLEEEIVNVEVWSYNDNRLHTQQKVRQKDDEKKAYIVRYDLKKKSFHQITNSVDVHNVLFTDKRNEDNYFCFAEEHYLKTISWEGFPSYKDLYVVSKNGSKELVASKIKGNPRISPLGKYIYYFDYAASIWYCIDTKTKVKTNLSQKIDASVTREDFDMPADPSPYGSAGWSEQDGSFFIYDRYDVWEVKPSNAIEPNKLTDGRKDKTRYRFLRLDPEKNFIDKSEPMLFSIYDDNTGEGGIAQFNWRTNTLHENMRSSHRYLRPLKAKNSDELIIQRENFNEFPDLELTNILFHDVAKITSINPQQKEYSWGSIEWYHWTSLDGQKLRGLLVKPENFDPNKKYPMIVNFYEKSSERIHNHRPPYPGRSTISYSYYANQGYLIFNPDVPYRDGYPGESAYNAVISGVSALIGEGFVQEDKIGAQGHSWGGYQVAHLITKTDLFACVESGAPVVNMTSAYGGIRWGSGLSRMFQYEHTQSRIGGTLWDKPLRYLENSPIFFVDKINTPVLIMHNDKDGHVPWYQGIEFFVSMRRLNKPAWLLNYNDEPHWPVKRQNRVDFQTRMQQYFDYYLMDKPQPNWMKNGVSAMEKGKKQGLEID